jgi:phosphopantetheine--protein transferase-like protein
MPGSENSTAARQQNNYKLVEFLLPGMDIKIGSDILQLKKFRAAFKKYPQKFERDIFCESELENSEITHLAGFFAAKEAVIKALDLGAGQWKSVEIQNKKSGKPILKFNGIPQTENIKSYDLSISHHGDYVIAMVAILLK